MSAFRLVAVCLLSVMLLAPLGATVAADSEAHDAHAADTHGAAAGDGHGDAHADAHDGHGPLTFEGVIKNKEFWGTLVNFGLLMFIFGWAIKNKINPSLAAKRDVIEKDLKEAARLKQEAEAKHAAFQARLDKLDAEVDTIRAEMITAGEAERDRIVSEAEEKATRMRKDTAFMIDQQLKQLRQDLTREAAQAAVQAAEGMLGSQTTDADQDRLADLYLKRLDEVAARGES